MMFKRSLCWGLQVIFVGVMCAQVAANGFVAGTLVKVPGGYVEIETIVAGDLVCCRGKVGTIVERPVTAIVRCRPAQTCLVIQCVNGVELRVSLQQEFFVGDVEQENKDAWVKAGELTSRKLLLSAARHKEYAISGVWRVKLPPVLRAESDTQPEFYGLTIDDENNFLVTKYDVIAHN